MRLGQLRPGTSITVVEREPVVGGLARAWAVNEFTADLGPHRVYTELPEIERLLPDLIARDQMITVERRSQLLLRGHFFDYPVRAGELLGQFGLLSMAGFALSAALGKTRAVMRPPRNFEQAMADAFGARAYGLLVGPYARKVWKTDPGCLSVEVARVRVSAGGAAQMIRRLVGRARAEARRPTALREFAYIRGGVARLVESLAHRAERAGARLVTHASVESFEGTPKGLTSVVIRHASGQTERLATDAVISTMPITDLAALLDPLAPDRAARDAAGCLTYLGMMLVALVIRRPQLTPNTWLYFPEEHLVFNRAYEPRNFDPGMAPSDRSLAVFEVTARPESDLWGMPDEDVARRVAADACSTGLLREEEIEAAHVMRLSHAYPLYTTDFRQHLDTVCGALARFGNLVSTGRQGLFNHNNMDHSMLMGIRAAECLAESARLGESAGARWLANLGQFAHFRIVD
jgi:protoporphyrinogen oxidase